MPGVSNRTQSNKNPIELNRTIGVRLGSAIEQIRTSILLWVRFSNQSNKVELIRCNFVRTVHCIFWRRNLVPRAFPLKVPSREKPWERGCWRRKLVKHVGYSHYPDIFEMFTESRVKRGTCIDFHGRDSVLKDAVLTLPWGFWAAVGFYWPN